MANLKILLPQFLLLVLSIGKCDSASIQDDSNVNLSKHPVFIIISYDGFRHDYMNKTDTPNLDMVKANGTSAPYMRNQFISNTFPNHHTMATGLYIESHGIVGNSFYDLKLEKFLSGYNDDPGFWNYSKEIIPLWTANELAGDDRHSGVMMWCGSAEPWGPQDTKPTYIVKYNSSENYPYEKRVDDVISWITDPEKPANLVFFYVDEPDKAGHAAGPNSVEVLEAIKKVDNITGYFLDSLNDLGILEQVNLIFLSDHGMAEIPVNRFIPHEDFMENVNETVYEEKHGTPVLQILPVNENNTQLIYETFKNQTENYPFAVYMTNQLRELKPNWHYAAPNRVMPIILVAESGMVFQDYWGLQENVTTGTHGFDPDEDMQMYPYFMAMGPLFKRNAVLEPFDNVDIYPFVSAILGLESVAHESNGTYENMLPLLTYDARGAYFTPKDDGGLSTAAIIGIVFGVLAVVIIVAVGIFYVRRRGYSSA